MKLFAGPWVGEFGWELMMWQGHIRAMAKKYDEVIVAARADRRYLYEDFCTDFVPVECGNVTDGATCRGYMYNSIHTKYIGKEDTFFPSQQFIAPWREPEHLEKFNEQEFIKYGTASKDKHYDIIIHARSTDKINTSIRNWSQKKWNELVASFPDKKICCIGASGAASHIDNTIDLRNIPLKELADIMASSSVIVGPSSGPLHYASLCGLTHIVYTPHYNRKRYERFWNPLQTKCEVIDQFEWDPPVNVVCKTISENI